MSFPTTVSKQGLAEILATVLGTDKASSDQLALAVYDLAGFALFKVFGDVKYPVGGFNLSQIEQIISLPAFQNVGQLVTDFQAALASGQTKFQAFFALLLKYGPTIAETVLQIVALTGK